jgi:hypothetical protein
VNQESEALAAAQTAQAKASALRWTWEVATGDVGAATADTTRAELAATMFRAAWTEVGQYVVRVLRAAEATFRYTYATGPVSPVGAVDPTRSSHPYAQAVAPVALQLYVARLERAVFEEDSRGWPAQPLPHLRPRVGLPGTSDNLGQGNIARVALTPQTVPDLHGKATVSVDRVAFLPVALPLDTLGRLHGLTWW